MSRLRILLPPPRSLALILAALGVAACSDDAERQPVAPETGELAPDEVASSGPLSSATGSTGPLRVTSRFSLSVDAEGRLEPGTPIEVTLSGTSHLATPRAAFYVTLPEVEAAKRSSWGPGFRVPTGEPLAPVASWEEGRSRGSPFRYTTTARIPRPGYYRVAASARRVSELPRSQEGRRIQDVAHDELWLLIREEGGAVTASFEPDSLPEDAVAQPGPFRVRRGPGQEGGAAPSRRGQTEDAGAPGVRWASLFPGALDALGSLVRRTGLDRLFRAAGLRPASELTWEILYYSQDDSAYVPVPHADYFVKFLEEVCDDDGGGTLLAQSCTFNTVGSTSGETDSQGRITLECRDGEFYDGEVHTANTMVAVTPNNEGHFFGDFDQDCGQTFDEKLQSMTTPSKAARVFIGTVMSAQESWALFDITRPQIEVQLTHAQDSSYAGLYEWDADRIRIDTVHAVWGEQGYATQAHEYGHALHNTALGGFPPREPCPDDLTTSRFTSETNFSCAFIEGFATYHEALTAGPLGIMFDDVSENTGLQEGEDGGLIEGAVAAFFFDLTTDIGDGGEDFDNLNLAPSYLGDVIATCDVLESGSWIRGNGVDHYVYCLENEVDEEVLASPDYFPFRESDPEAQEEEATEPPEWNMAKIRALWRYDLYKNGS